LIKTDRDGNCDRFAITGRTRRTRIDGNLGILDRRPLQITLDGCLDRRCGGTIEDCHPRPFPRGVRDDLLDHDHASKLDHPEDHQEEEGGDDRELHDGGPSTISSA
jgi:hypothetical protein